MNASTFDVGAAKNARISVSERKGILVAIQIQLEQLNKIYNEFDGTFNIAGMVKSCL